MVKIKGVPSTLSRVNNMLYEIESGEFDLETMDSWDVQYRFGELFAMLESEDDEFIGGSTERPNKEYVCRLILKWWNESIGTMTVEDGDLVVAPRTSITMSIMRFIGAYREIFKALALLEVAVHEPPFIPDGYVYVLKAGPYYKIGRATDLDRRIKQLKVQLPFEVELIHVILCENHEASEKYWHTRFGEYRSNGEWFELESDHLMEIKRCLGMRGEEKL